MNTQSNRAMGLDEVRSLTEIAAQLGLTYTETHRAFSSGMRKLRHNARLRAAWSRHQREKAELQGLIQRSGVGA